MPEENTHTQKWGDTQSGSRTSNAHGELVRVRELEKALPSIKRRDGPHGGS